MARAKLPALPSPSNYDILEKSAEEMDWLRGNIKIGYTTERGPAWWAAGAVTKDGTWETIPDGSHFEGPVPLEEVRKLLDVRLVKGQVHVTYEDEDGHRQVVTDPAVMPIVNQRTGKVFSYPKDGYRIHPYLATLHNFIEQIAFDEKVGVGSVGLLRNGGVAFLQVVLPETIEVEGFGFQPYLMGVTSADTSRSTKYVTGAKAGVCDNTVDAAVLGAVTKAVFKHTRNSMPKVQAAREKLGIRLAEAGEEMAGAITELTRISVSDKEFAAWLDLTEPWPEKPDKEDQRGYKRALTMTEGRREEKLRLWRKDEKVAPWAGTAFGVLQLDNTWRTWTQTVRSAGGGRLERNYSNAALGLTAQADRSALEALAAVKEGKLVIA